MDVKTIAVALIGGWLALLVAGSAHSADWRTLSGEDGMQVYLDEASVVRKGPVTRATIMRNHSLTQTLGDDWYPHRSQVVRYELVCSSRSASIKSWAFRAGELGSGSTVWEQRNPWATPARVADGTTEQALVSRLCDAPLASAQDR